MLPVEIRVKGQIDQRWSEWLDGLTITHTDQDETVLTGSVVDQAALYGMIAKLRDLGLPLLAVNLVVSIAEPSVKQDVPQDAGRCGR
jgi:hypothetical protein